MARQARCRNCDALLILNGNTYGYYCSNACQREYEWNQAKKEIELAGKVKNSHQGRRYLLDMKGHLCEICGRSTWVGKPIPLVLDHIDGNPDNWALSNIRLICCNDDAKTATYKNRNRGRGRAYRRERYHAGKSY